MGLNEGMEVREKGDEAIIGLKKVMANKDGFGSAVKVKNWTRKRGSCGFVQHSSLVSTEESDLSPLTTHFDSEPLQSLYRELSPATESHTRQLTHDLSLLYAVLDSEIDPVSVRDRAKSLKQCQLREIKSSFVMQRRKQLNSI